MFISKLLAQKDRTSYWCERALSLHNIDLSMTKIPKKAMKPIWKSTLCPMVISRGILYKDALQKRRTMMEDCTSQSKREYEEHERLAKRKKRKEE